MCAQEGFVQEGIETSFILGDNKKQICVDKVEGLRTEVYWASIQINCGNNTTII